MIIVDNMNARVMEIRKAMQIWIGKSNNVDSSNSDTGAQKRAKKAADKLTEIPEKDNPGDSNESTHESRIQLLANFVTKTYGNLPMTDNAIIYVITIQKFTICRRFCNSKHSFSELGNIPTETRKGVMHISTMCTLSSMEANYNELPSLNALIPGHLSVGQQKKN